MASRTLVFAFVGLVAASSALAAGTFKHSGRIVAVDPAKHVVTLEEMGPWTPRHSALVKWSIMLEPSTKIKLDTRAEQTGAGGWLGGFSESSLTTSELKPGDFVTVVVQRAGHRLEAVSVEV